MYRISSAVWAMKRKNDIRMRFFDKKQEIESMQNDFDRTFLRYSFQYLTLIDYYYYYELVYAVYKMRNNGKW